MYKNIKYLKAGLLLLFLQTLMVCKPASDKETDFLAYDPNQYEQVVIDYKVYGKQDTVLLFIHGWNINQTYWVNQVNSLQNQYKVITLDLAGHGNSGKNRKSWTAESFARDIVNLIEKEKLANIILIGHSMGGEIALEVYSAIPEKIISIIGIDNFKDISFQVDPEFRKGFPGYLEEFKNNYPKMAEQFARENIKSKDSAIVHRIVEDYRKADPGIALAIFKNMVPKYDQEKYRLQELTFPLILIVCDYSPVEEEALQQYVKTGYHLEWIHDSGHFPMLEQPEQFNATLDKSLEHIAIGN